MATRILLPSQHTVHHHLDHSLDHQPGLWPNSRSGLPSAFTASLPVLSITGSALSVGSFDGQRNQIGPSLVGLELSVRLDRDPAVQATIAKFRACRMRPRWDCELPESNWQQPPQQVVSHQLRVGSCPSHPPLASRLISPSLRRSLRPHFGPLFWVNFVVSTPVQACATDRLGISRQSASCKANSLGTNFIIRTINRLKLSVHRSILCLRIEPLSRAMIGSSSPQRSSRLGMPGHGLSTPQQVG